MKLFKRAPRSLFIVAICSIIGLAATAPSLMAQGSENGSQGFSIQVTPSPLIATIKPGEKSELELRIRNTGPDTQTLKMGMRAFSVDEESGKVELGNDTPPEVTEFVRFAQPTFTLKGGELMTQKIVINTPKSAGFTYSFAITVSKQIQQKPQDGTAAIEGSVAIFTLLNVDREGAVRKFELGEFSTKKRVYEYLPASFDLKLKNTGNTIVQPRGNIFIQRGSNDTEPIATLPINGGGGYILPNTNRILSTDWSNGFPRYQTSTDGNGNSQEKLSWNWNDLSDFRFGKYTAKVVAIYDDGQRDVPISTEINFWVIPWRIIGGSLLILLLVLIGVFTLLKRTTSVIKIRKKPAKDDSKTSN